MRRLAVVQLRFTTYRNALQVMDVPREARAGLSYLAVAVPLASHHALVLKEKGAGCGNKDIRRLRYEYETLPY
jgi:hypothetical protein